MNSNILEPETEEELDDTLLDVDWNTYEKMGRKLGLPPDELLYMDTEKIINHIRSNFGEKVAQGITRWAEKEDINTIICKMEV